ncbi:hypothetical protein Nham_1629 [Nitrobacter hamburgensis X14]|uniref:Uncharacterized protein n=1 Tax=Nitrobacter hamburgensis (strain DSM 10229 / NCIMB 13809 / X14) TaxID=323097 RepID=Q1QMU9_NITHX|nr:hypothetical protein [Nitrobacter hamburgensis]ABE62448.1 hypothetical protein Nham_1629 [Nitrobacter hamburgensis X14]
MARFVILEPRQGKQVEIDFAEFVEFVKGATVQTAAAGKNFLELGLAEQMNVRIQTLDNGDLAVTIMSTLNEGDIPPIRLQIIEADEIASAALVESRIRALRQSYAIVNLLQNDGAEALQRVLADDPNVDLELMLIPEERLFITAAAAGSFWLTIVTKSAKAYKIAKYALALPYKEGREALLRRVEADTRLRELAVEEKQAELGLKRVKGLVDTFNSIEKIKDKTGRERLKDSFLNNLEQLVDGI